MTRSEVGRLRRTASRLAYAPPIGERSFGSPPSQAAAERAHVRADRAALRFGLRTLIVAGIAGAAWLLCANAAQAASAPATDRTTDPSAVDLVPVIGAGVPVIGVDQALPTARAASTTFALDVAKALTSAHQPVMDTAAAQVTGVPVPALPSLGDAPTSRSSRGQITRPAVSIAGVAVTPIGGTADHAVPNAQPARPAGASRTARIPVPALLGRGIRGDHNAGVLLFAPLGGAGTPVSATLDGVLAKATGWLRDAVRPVAAPSSALPGVVLPGDEVARPVPAPNLGVRGMAPAVRSGEGRRGPGGNPIGAGGRPMAVTAAPAFVARVVTAASDWTAAGRPAALGGGTGVPTGGLPVPSHGWAGPAGPAGGSTAPAEGAGFALATSAVAAGTSVPGRPVVPADVEVLRLDAEAPTVSPD